LADEDELVCAQVFLPECTSTIREKVFRGQLTQAEGLTIVNEILSLPLRLSHSPYQFTRAMDLANQRHMLKSYDMQYVAVAEIEGCTLVTLDGGPYQAAIEIGVPARLLR
jgi:predicted nucleic acid-binding protein